MHGIVLVTIITKDFINLEPKCGGGLPRKDLALSFPKTDHEAR